MNFKLNLKEKAIIQLMQRGPTLYWKALIK